MMQRNNIWYVVVVIWLVALVMWISQRWMFPQLPWVLSIPMAEMWPVCMFSIFLGAASFRLFVIVPQNPVVVPYETAVAMRFIRRCGLLALVSIPVLGTVGVTFLYPVLLFAGEMGKPPCHPWQAGIFGLVLFGLGSLFLWQTRRWLRMGVILLVAMLITLWPISPGTSHQTCYLLWDGWATQHMSRHIFVAMLGWLIFGFFWRWLWQQSNYQAPLQQSAYILLGSLWFGQIAWWIHPYARFWQIGLSVVLGVCLVGVWVGSGLAALWKAKQLFRNDLAFQARNLRPYVLGANVPFASLIALWGWISTPPDVTFFVLFLGSQWLAFQSLSLLQSIHHTALKQPHTGWVFLRPTLLFVVLYFPFGAIGLALLGMWRGR